MKIGVLVFIDNMLGGLGTQAYDLAKTAHELGHEAKVIVFSSTKKSWGKPPGFTATFGPNENGTNLVIRDVQLSTHPEKCAETVDYLAAYDLLIWIGVAPHLIEGDPEIDLYDHILTLPCRHVAFATDRFIDKLYPWIKTRFTQFDRLLSFAEPYVQALRNAGSGAVDIVPICPLESWKRRTLGKPTLDRPSPTFWPHQWRGWKNINMFLEIAPALGCDIEVYASGSGIEYSQYKKSPAYAKDVKWDVHSSQLNPMGNLTLRGYANHEEILEAYGSNKGVLDLTGIAQLSHKPNSYVGNYQCATLEAMCYGCALIKMESTVAPHNCLPQEAVVKLPTGLRTEDYAARIKDILSDDQAMQEAAENALEWIEGNTNPYDLFERYFLA